MIVNEEAVKKILEEVKPAKLVAATKYVDVKEIEKLEKLGVTCFGENRVQAFLEKYENYHGNGEFQFIGTLQPNKVKYIIAFILILIITGIIFVKMDLNISNPTLVLLGYKLYKIRLKDYNDVITVISGNKLINGDSIEWIEMDQQCWYVKRCNNEDRKA